MPSVYLNGAGEVVHKFARTPEYNQDLLWLIKDENNRVFYTFANEAGSYSNVDTGWYEVKLTEVKSASSKTIAQDDLPKVIQMMLLIGAI